MNDLNTDEKLALIRWHGDMIRTNESLGLIAWHAKRVVDLMKSIPKEEDIDP